MELVIVKQAIDELDSGKLWEYRLPAVAATPSQLEAVKSSIREPLDPGYRDFLKHAGGWPAFWQTVDLFGPEDLLGGPRFQHALQVLGHVEDSVLEEADLRRSDLLPIAASPVDLDLFVMTRRSSPSPGTVVWLAGTEVDRFRSFERFFLAMIDYNRWELQKLQEASGGMTNMGEYVPLWTSQKHDYIILRLGEPGNLSTHTVVNKFTESALLIEDEELKVAVIRRMIEAGVPIVDHFP